MPKVIALPDQTFDEIELWAIVEKLSASELVQRLLTQCLQDRQQKLRPSAVWPPANRELRSK